MGAHACTCSILCLIVQYMNELNKLIIMQNKLIIFENKLIIIIYNYAFLSGKKIITVDFTYHTLKNGLAVNT